MQPSFRHTHIEFVADCDVTLSKPKVLIYLLHRFLVCSPVEAMVIDPLPQVLLVKFGALPRLYDLQ
jgi:hypothetical protein